MSDETNLVFWAKKKKESADLYPLLYHMIDAFAVTSELCKQSLQRDARKSVAKELGLGENESGLLLAFLAGLHDIGKASVGFQCKDENTKRELQQLGFSVSGTDPPHGIITTVLLREFLKDKAQQELARELAMVLGGHHGVFPRSIDINDVTTGAGPWPQAQKQLYETYRHLCGGDTLPPLAARPSPAFFMFLAGLVSVADWIASNDKECFPYPVNHGIKEHLNYARERARQALETLGWTGWQPPSTMAEFGDLFRNKDGGPLRPRPLQVEAINLAEAIENQAGLVIIEAPMGEGKTEAAIYLADSWIWHLGQKGYYFALPTMATSDQMFGRVEAYLKNRYHDDKVNFMLLHGHAALSAEFELLKKNFVKFTVADVSDSKGYDGASAGVVASEWFTYRKRGLLAPFGVGTVDQILLAVLQTRHVFVRLFGLANKTVIIDEIHAYDAYMTTLLERLLEWLAALGTSVVMLSATLPRGRRDALLRAYVRGLDKGNSDLLLEVPEAKYPRISWTVDGKFHAKSIDTSPGSRKELRLEWIDGNLPTDGDEFPLGRQLQGALSGGGCAAVICNTVDQAQEVYKALKKYFDGVADDGQPKLDLLHARYLFGARKQREERSLIRFGKPDGKVRCEDGEYSVLRPDCAVLVSTQIIEQSLDLDFDLMVTEMAPVDLLLQRAGRLHRHQRARPAKLKEPTLWICLPKAEDGVPNFGGGTEDVYDRHILLRSWLALTHPQIRLSADIPGDVEYLIEEVYGDRECPTELLEAVKRKWDKSLEQLQVDRGNYESKARENRILSSTLDAESMLEQFNKSLEEDNPDIHEALQALTRISEAPTVSVICLNGTLQHAHISNKAIDMNTEPDRDATRKMLAYSVSISRKGLTNAILREATPVPEAWLKKPQLRHHRLLFFNDDATCPVGNHALKLDKELGLTIQKREG